MKSIKAFNRLLRLSILSVIIIYSLPAQVTDTIRVEAGWNLLSLSISVKNGVKTLLFPSATSDAFIYQGNYVSKDTLENLMGFWLKFDSMEAFTINGGPITRDTIDVSAGWNLIGAITNPIILDSVSTNPPGIIISDFFNFITEVGYQSSDTIKPGQGFWVKVKENGQIILNNLSCPGIPTVEYEGKLYNTVYVGNQCWLKENLNVGIRINGNRYASDNGTIEKYCYNDDTVNCNIYGGLYQWNEAMQYTTVGGTRGICPLGWHIPTQAEFQTLSTTVGGNNIALKAIGQGTGDGAGTNTSGFSALLSGYRSYNYYFYYLGASAYFWSSMEYNSTGAIVIYMYSNISLINLNYIGDKTYGFSVRCIMD